MLSLATLTILCLFLLVIIRALVFAGLAVSSRHTYMFSAGDDKQVKCWDLEQNKVGISMNPQCVFF